MVFMKKKKQGFGGVVSTLIMFIAIVGVSTALVISMKNYVTDTQDAMAFQNNLANDKLRSAVSISNIYYNSTSNDLFVYVKNIGQKVLSTTDMNLFVDGKYENNFNIYYADNFTKNMTLFEPSETFVLIYNNNFVAGSHEIKIVTNIGVSDKDYFSN